MSAPREIRLAELVACLALATDIGMGQPFDHGLRTCLLAVGIGERLGLGEDQLADVYYVSLLRFVGCNAHAQEDASETGDEIAFRAGVAPILSGPPSDFMRFMLKHLGEGLPRATRAKLIVGALAAGSKGARQSVATTCEVAQMIATRLGLGASVVDALGYTFEHHNGKGLPKGASGEEIPDAAHVAMVARDFEVLYRLGGRDLALDVMEGRRGSAYDPRVLDAFLDRGASLLEGEESEPGWDAVLAAEPQGGPTLSGARFEDALGCIGDFSDVKSPFTHGYSHRVADLTKGAAEAMSLETSDVDRLRAAAFVQELGMAGVQNAVLEKPGSPSEGEWERIRLHPYLTERILARCVALSDVGALASAHHERIDGDGYHRGLKGPQLSMPGRLLAAAGAYVAMTSERPWRPAMPAREAALTLRREAADGRFDTTCAEAVLQAVGHKTAPARRTWPAGLTDREVEVLRLITQGRSNRQVAGALVISPKTAGRHVENIYSKIGVSSRAAAAVFALQHDLVGPATLGDLPKMG